MSGHSDITKNPGVSHIICRFWKTRDFCNNDFQIIEQEVTHLNITTTVGLLGHNFLDLN